MMPHDPDDLLVRIQSACEAHAQLRAKPPSSRTLDEKRPLFEAIKVLLDDLWHQTGQLTDRAVAESARSAIRSLTLDAEWFAGVQNEGEGFRDAADVAAQYDLLKRHLASASADD